MAEEIIVSYKAVPTGFDKVGAAVSSVTGETKELQNQIKATFADKSIDEATVKLQNQEQAVAELVQQYGGASKVLKEVEKDLVALSLAGKGNTAEYKALSKEAAKLKDAIGDTRNEIKKMASDTRVFDTMVQGARGIAAAFSVATGLAATFGAENENLQKTLLKVQGAMAALQGVQELANIATEKGGIATKAYGVALQVVEKISKVTGLSMAASWALATGGITILIGALTALYMWYQKTGEEAEKQAEAERKRQELIAKYIGEAQSKAYKKVMEVNAEFDRNQERRKQQAILNAEDLAVVELGLLKDKIAQSEKVLRDFNLVKVFLNEEDAKKYKQYLEDRVLDAKVAYKKIFDSINTPQVSPTENVTPITKVEPLVTQDVVDMNKRNIEKEVKDLRELGLKRAEEAEAESLARRKQQQEAYFQAIGTSIQALSTLVNGIYSAETSELEMQKEEQLRIAGDDARRREQIEKDFAVKKAKIAREQAIANKAFSIFQIGLSTAQAIISALGAVPYSPANIALAAAAGALGAAQLAAAAATPLPAVPKFEKGGAVVLAGGVMNDGMLFGRSHREGGMLINAQGGEYIWDIPTVKKHGDLIKAAHENRLEDLVMHKYIAPVLAASKTSYQAESYDDVLLRKTIRDTSERSTRAIVKGISQSINESAYFKDRYK